MLPACISRACVVTQGHQLSWTNSVTYLEPSGTNGNLHVYQCCAVYQLMLIQTAQRHPAITQSPLPSHDFCCMKPDTHTPASEWQLHVCSQPMSIILHYTIHLSKYHQISFGTLSLPLPIIHLPSFVHSPRI